MSFFTALTGLKGAQTDISTTSNNIANVGSAGFKKSRAEFGDIFSTTPLQTNLVGSGAQQKSITQQFSQGNIQQSTNTLDMAVSGQGFFALKAGGSQCSEAVLASDGFFPFADTVELANEYGIKAIIQPGGSLRDQESIDMCNAKGISMVFTQKRHFLH